MNHEDLARSQIIMAALDDARTERSALDHKKLRALTQAGAEDLSPADFIRYGELRECIRTLNKELDHLLGIQ